MQQTLVALLPLQAHSCCSAIVRSVMEVRGATMRYR
jgi:hypothetical protein